MTDRVIRPKIGSKFYKFLIGCVERDEAFELEGCSYKVTDAKRIYGTNLMRVELDKVIL